MSKENKEIKEKNSEQIIQSLDEMKKTREESAKQIEEAKKESAKLAEAEKARQKEEEERKAKAQQQEVEQREAKQKYEQALAEQTGEKGYGKALDMATRGAAVTSAQAGQAAQQAARQSGLSKAQAAQMGAQSAANQYAQNIAGQQNLATQQQQANVAGNLSGAGLTGQFAGANTANAQQGVSNAQMGVANTQQGIQNQFSLVGQQQAQNALAQGNLGTANASEQARVDRTWGVAKDAINTTGQVLQGVGSMINPISDKTMKKSEKIELPDAKKILDDMGTKLLSHSLKDMKNLPKVEPKNYVRKTIIEVGK